MASAPLLCQWLRTADAVHLTNGQAGSPTAGFFLNRPAGRKPLTSSFVSAWDLYQERIRRALTVIGSSEDRGAVPEPCVCVRVCVCVCANPIEDEPQTVPSMIVPVESSQ
jgi:hypothetical protein